MSLLRKEIVNEAQKILKQANIMLTHIRTIEQNIIDKKTDADILTEIALLTREVKKMKMDAQEQYDQHNINLAKTFLFSK